jgi:regulator of sirC expression with transglutaminase-like and TPR domain
VTGGPSRGLPPRTYLPILVVTALAFLGIVGYFLKIGLGSTGTALGPVAQQGDANIRASAAPAAPGEVVVPQSGGAPADAAAGGPNGVGGGTPPQARGAAPPAPVQRLLGELRERLQRNPNDLAALVNLANLYFDAGKYPQAIAYYKRALALDPANPDTRTDYATALHGSGRDLEALRELESILASRPRFPEALFNQGVVANAIGRRTEAIGAFRSFLKVAPNDQRAADARTALQNLGA